MFSPVLPGRPTWFSGMVLVLSRSLTCGCLHPARCLGSL
jgi:hypothetical protein